MAAEYLTSVDDLPGGGRAKRAIYHVWNEGDIAHQLDGLSLNDNPYSQEVEPLLWSTWQRGWEGRPLEGEVRVPPPVYFPLQPRNEYLGGKLPRRTWWQWMFGISL